jgi:hypothetical protein
MESSCSSPHTLGPVGPLRTTLGFLITKSIHLGRKYQLLRITLAAVFPNPCWCGRIFSVLLPRLTFPLHFVHLEISSLLSHFSQALCAMQLLLKQDP